MRKEALFIVLLAMVAVASADVQITAYSVLPTTLKPGVTGSATITVYNPSSSTLNGVVIYQGGAQFTFTSNRVQLGDIGTLGSTVITIPFIIKDDVTPGVYNLKLDAFWTEGSETRTKTFSIPISVTNPPIFRLSFNSLKQITPGEKFTVEGQIKNEGGSISKVVLTVNSTSFFFDRVSQISLGDLAGGDNVSIKLPMVASASLEAGVQSIPLIISYQDPMGAAQQTVISINPVEVGKSSVDFIVAAQPEKKPVSAGDKMKLFVNLTDTGNSNAYSAKITVSSNSSYFTSLGASERYFEVISPASKEQMEFEIGVSGSTPAGYYPLTITLNYLNVNGEAQTPVQKQVGIEVGGSPEISITSNTNPSPVSAGGAYALSLQFSNTGTINVRALAVDVSSEDFEVLSSPGNYIGTLNLDDYSTVTYTIHARGNLQPGKYPIHVSMSYRDAYNVLHSEIQQVLLEIVTPDVAALTQKPAGMSLTSIVIILAVIGIIGYVIYKRYFKKKAK
jgi:uncharacterized membrane protein